MQEAVAQLDVSPVLVDRGQSSEIYKLGNTNQYKAVLGVPTWTFDSTDNKWVGINVIDNRAFTNDLTVQSGLITVKFVNDQVYFYNANFTQYDNPVTEQWILKNGISTVTKTFQSLDLIQNGNNANVTKTYSTSLGNYIVKYIFREGLHLKHEVTLQTATTGTYTTIQQWTLQVDKYIRADGTVIDISALPDGSITVSKALLGDKLKSLQFQKTGLPVVFELLQSAWDNFISVKLTKAGATTVTVEFLYGTWTNGFTLDPDTATLNYSTRLAPGKTVSGGACTGTDIGAGFSIQMMPFGYYTTGECYRGGAEFSTGSIPDNAIISQIDFTFHITEVNSSYNCNYMPMVQNGAQPSTLTVAQQWTEIGDGTPYISNNTVCTTTGTNKLVTLGSSANTDLQNKLSVNWFAVGVKGNSETPDVNHLTAACLNANGCGQTPTPVPTITVTYTIPTVTQPITLSVSSSGGSGNSVTATLTNCAPSPSTINVTTTPTTTNVTANPSCTITVSFTNGADEKWILQDDLTVSFTVATCPSGTCSTVTKVVYDVLRLNTNKTVDTGAPTCDLTYSTAPVSQGSSDSPQTKVVALPNTATDYWVRRNTTPTAESPCDADASQAWVTSDTYAQMTVQQTKVIAYIKHMVATISLYSDSPDPITEGYQITFTINWSDVESDTQKGHICKTNAITWSVSGGSCTVSSWADSPSLTGTTPINLTYTATASDVGTLTYYVFVCDSVAHCTGTVSNSGTVTVNANSAPTISLITDSPDPLIYDATITFETTWSDGDAETVKVHICKTNAATASSAGGSCDAGSWNDSSLTTTSPLQLTYVTLITDEGTKNYYVFVCDSNTSTAKCSTSSSGTFTVQRLTFTLTLNASSGNGTPEGSALSFSTSGCNVSPTSLDGNPSAVALTVDKSCTLTLASINSSGHRFDFQEDHANITFSIGTTNATSATRYYYEIFDLTYSVRGSPSPMPTFAFTAAPVAAGATDNPQSKNVTLTASPTAYSAKEGTAWTVAPATITVSGTERYITYQTVTNTVTTTVTTAFDYQHEFLISDLRTNANFTTQNSKTLRNKPTAFKVVMGNGTIFNHPVGGWLGQVDSVQVNTLDTYIWNGINKTNDSTFTISSTAPAIAVQGIQADAANNVQLAVEGAITTGTVTYDSSLKKMLWTSTGATGSGQFDLVVDEVNASFQTEPTYLKINGTKYINTTPRWQYNDSPNFIFTFTNVEFSGNDFELGFFQTDLQLWVFDEFDNANYLNGNYCAEVFGSLNVTRANLCVVAGHNINATINGDAQYIRLTRSPLTLDQYWREWRAPDPTNPAQIANFYMANETERDVQTYRLFLQTSQSKWKPAVTEWHVHKVSELASDITIEDQLMDAEFKIIPHLVNGERYKLELHHKTTGETLILGDLNADAILDKFFIPELGISTQGEVWLIQQTRNQAYDQLIINVTRATTPFTLNLHIYDLISTSTWYNYTSVNRIDAAIPVLANRTYYVAGYSHNSPDSAQFNFFNARQNIGISNFAVFNDLGTVFGINPVNIFPLLVAAIAVIRNTYAFSLILGAAIGFMSLLGIITINNWEWGVYGVLIAVGLFMGRKYL